MGVKKVVMNNTKHFGFESPSKIYLIYEQSFIGDEEETRVCSYSFDREKALDILQGLLENEISRRDTESRLIEMSKENPCDEHLGKWRNLLPMTLTYFMRSATLNYEVV